MNHKDKHRQVASSLHASTPLRGDCQVDQKHAITRFNWLKTALPSLIGKDSLNSPTGGMDN